MAPRSAASPRSRRPHDEIDEEPGYGDFVARHRRLIGGLTAFAVAFAYVAANAIWYQPHAHGGAFFETRPIAGAPMDAAAPAEDTVELETIIRLERETADSGTADEVAALPASAPLALPPARPMATADADRPAAQAIPTGDPVLKEVQRVLASLNLYDGDVDGLTGPKTRQAVETYRKTVGLSTSAEIDERLLQQLGIAEIAARPPLPRESPGTDLIETSSAPSSPAGDPTVMRIQAGLKAFGNDGIEIDGVVGARTRSAILEFQSLFGLPETGEPDTALYAKMREIGLTE